MSHIPSSRHKALVKFALSGTVAHEKVITPSPHPTPPTPLSPPRSSPCQMSSQQQELVGGWALGSCVAAL